MPECNLPYPGIRVVAPCSSERRPPRSCGLCLRGLAARITFLLAVALFALGPALADTVARPATPNVRAATGPSSCPSTDFAAFLHAFSQFPALQRRYTHFPLKFGLLDPDLVATDKEDHAFKTSMIGTFEKIPNYYPDSGTVFPTPTQMKEDGLETTIFTTKNSKTVKDKNAFPEEIINDPASVTVLVNLPDTGLVVFYRFRKTQGCWFLFAISDRSIL
jgi:hypothetical protein